MNVMGGASRRTALGAALLATAALGSPGLVGAQGQQPTGSGAIGPDALRDFNLQPQRRIVAPPRPTTTPPAATPAPVPTLPPAPPPAQPNGAPATTGSRPVPNPTIPSPSPRVTPQPAARAPVATTPAQGRPGAAPQPQPQGQAAPAPAPVPTPAPIADSPPTAAAPAVPEAPTPAAAPAASSDGLPAWVYGLGAALLAFGAFLFLRRRGGAALALPSPEDDVEEAREHLVPQPSLPRVPRPDPLPRPWIELDLVAERATADAQESVVEFALTIRNSGGSVARNLKLQAKLICGTLTQDEEIAAFQRKKPGEHRTIALPELPAGEEITIQGRVDSKGEELKALRVEQKLLFIPLVVVNAHYDWNSSRSGQTSKSFLVGREKPDPAERMAPFRLDLGPRVYRTVGQRPYKIQRRV